MIKRYAIHKFTVSTLCLILLAMFYFFPTKNELYEEVIEDNNNISHIVYLLDDDNYLSQVIVYYDKLSIEDDIKKRIDILINGIDGLNYFYPLIPKGTKVNNVKVDKDNVYIDFSEELFNINNYTKEYMIESIIYTLTEINGINNIYITIDNNKLDNISYPLTRKYGINKTYNINSFNNLNQTTVYFSKHNNDTDYYVPVTKISNLDSEKIDIIIYELKNSVNAQDNLSSSIDNNLELVSYSIEDNKMILMFNSDKILESVSYEISSSIFDNYEVDEVTFNTEDKSNIISIKK